MQKNDIKRNIRRLLVGLVVLLVLGVVHFLSFFFMKEFPSYRHTDFTPYNTINTIQEYVTYKISGRPQSVDEFCEELMAPVWEHAQDYENCRFQMILEGERFYVYRDGDLMQGIVYSGYQDNCGHEMEHQFYAEKGPVNTTFWINMNETWYEVAVPNSYIDIYSIPLWANQATSLTYSDYPKVTWEEIRGRISSDVATDKFEGSLYCPCHFYYLHGTNSSFHRFESFGGVHIFPVEIPKEQIAVSEDFSFLHPPKNAQEQQ